MSPKSDTIGGFNEYTSCANLCPNLCPNPLRLQLPYTNNLQILVNYILAHGSQLQISKTQHVSQQFGLMNTE